MRCIFILRHVAGVLLKQDFIVVLLNRNVGAAAYQRIVVAIALGIRYLVSVENVLRHIVGSGVVSGVDGFDLVLGYDSARGMGKYIQNLRERILGRYVYHLIGSIGVIDLRLVSGQCRNFSCSAFHQGFVYGLALLGLSGLQGFQICVNLIAIHCGKVGEILVVGNSVLIYHSVDGKYDILGADSFTGIHGVHILYLGEIDIISQQEVEVSVAFADSISSGQRTVGGDFVGIRQVYQADVAVCIQLEGRAVVRTYRV